MNGEVEEVIQGIKFTKELVLAVSDLDKKMGIKVDTSDYVTGEVLFMECKNRR